MAFAGDGAMNEGAMAESLNLASIWRLPVVFAIEDNGFGEATASAHVTAGSFSRRAAISRWSRRPAAALVGL